MLKGMHAALTVNYMYKQQITNTFVKFTLIYLMYLTYGVTSNQRLYSS